MGTRHAHSYIHEFLFLKGLSKTTHLHKHIAQKNSILAAKLMKPTVEFIYHQTILIRIQHHYFCLVFPNRFDRKNITCIDFAYEGAVTFLQD